jgi:murein L,D-transpeptidase YafK
MADPPIRSTPRPAAAPPAGPGRRGAHRGARRRVLGLAGRLLGGAAAVALVGPLAGRAGPAAAHELLAASDPIDAIHVSKSARTMDLVRDGRVVQSYRIALGFAPEGHKERSGDGRTPEGTYRISALNRASQFHLSLRIDYPNADDVARARAAGVDPGGDIMIHGLAPANRHLGLLASYRDWTEGCIAVSNEEMEEIAALTPIGTPVIIEP